MTPFFSRSNLKEFRKTSHWACLLIALLVTGCRDRAQAPTAIVQIEATNIDTTLENLNPDVYELDSPRDTPILGLNTWAETHLQDMLVPEKTNEDLEESLSKYADAEFVKLTMREKFVVRDAAHIRDCLWAAGLAKSISKKGDSRLQSIVRDFYHVVHEMVLIQDTQAIPLGPFFSMVYGRGTDKTRAWAFAMLASQHQIPVGVFDFQRDDLPLVAAAILGGQIHLFDLTNGIPIADPLDFSDGAAWIETPATLAAVLKDDNFFVNFNSDEFKYPLKSADFKTAKIELVGDSSTWSRRMEGLNNALSGKTDAFVAQSFATYGSGEDEVIGDIAALEAAVVDLLPQDSIGIWSFPEEQRIGRESLSAAKQKQLTRWRRPFSVPRTVAGWQPLKIERGQYRQLAARAKQVIGQSEKAIPVYLAVQRWARLPPLGKTLKALKPEQIAAAQRKLPREILGMHMQAAEQAFYWRASSQFQIGNYRSAAKTFESYIRQYGSRPRSESYTNYVDEASYLAALTEVRKPLKNPEVQRVSLLSRGGGFMLRLTPTSSRYGAAQIWSARWHAMEKAIEQKAAAANPIEKPAEEPAKEPATEPAKPAEPIE